jgi:hypothetical protein
MTNISSHLEFVEDAKKQCADWQENAALLNTDPPDVDLREEVNEFCEALQFDNLEDQQQKVEAYIKPAVQKYINSWSKSMSHGHANLLQANQLSSDIDTEIGSIQSDIDSIKADLEELALKKTRLEHDLDQVAKVDRNTQPITVYAKLSYRIFIFGSLIIGIVTAWYYLQTQMQMLYNGNVNYFEQLLYDSGVVVDGFPGVVKMLQVAPEYAVYGLGVVMFLLAGKIISVIYEKLHHSSVFFISVSVICLGAVFGSVVLIGSVSSSSNELALLQAAAVEGNDLLGEACPPPDTPRDGLSASCLIKAENTEKQEKIRDAISQNGFYMILAVLLGEILIGGVAWMLASEYHEKREVEAGRNVSKKGKLGGELIIVERVQGEYQNNISTLKSAAQSLQSSKRVLSDMKQSLPSRSYVSDQRQAILNHQIQLGLSALQKKRHAWARNG